MLPPERGDPVVRTGDGDPVAALDGGQRVAGDLLRRRQSGPGMRSSAPPNPPISPNSVRTGPGQTAVTVTPVSRSSSWRASVNESTNALLAPYVAW